MFTCDRAPIAKHHTHPSPPKRDLDRASAEPVEVAASGVLVADARQAHPAGVPRHSSKDEGYRLNSSHQSQHSIGPRPFPQTFHRGTFQGPGTESVSSRRRLGQG